MTKIVYELSSFHKTFRSGPGRDSRPDSQRCCEIVYDGWWSKQCSRKRGFGPEAAYCKQHDPATVAARDAEKRVKWEADSKKYQLSFRAPQLLEALKKIAEGHDDPRALAAETIESLKL